MDEQVPEQQGAARDQHPRQRLSLTEEEPDRSRQSHKRIKCRGAGPTALGNHHASKCRAIRRVWR
jgi:hypothetical protein